MKPTAFRELVSLLDARKRRDLARLDRLLTEDRRMANEISELASTGTRDIASDPRHPFALQAARQAWADQRMSEARIRRAELAVAIRLARSEAVLSVGKQRALEELAIRSMALQRTTDPSD